MKKYLILLIAILCSCSTLQPIEPIDIDWSKCDSSHMTLPEQDNSVQWIDIASVHELENANHDCLTYVADTAEKNAQIARRNREAYEQKKPDFFDRVRDWIQGAAVGALVVLIGIAL